MRYYWKLLPFTNMQLIYMWRKMCHFLHSFNKPQTWAELSNDISYGNQFSTMVHISPSHSRLPNWHVFHTLWIYMCTPHRTETEISWNSLIFFEQLLEISMLTFTCLCVIHNSYTNTAKQQLVFKHGEIVDFLERLPSNSLMLKNDYIVNCKITVI